MVDDEIEREQALAGPCVTEAVTNAVKHARAHELRVDLEHLEGRLRITVRDDGIGGADLLAGSGLRGLVDRVEAHDGRLTVESPPGAGTKVVAEVPCRS